MERGFGRMLPCEQQVQKNAERVDIGSGGDRISGDLLWRGIGEGERPVAFAREWSRLVLQQLGNPKVE